MIIKIDIKGDLLDLIEKMIDDGKFSDIHQFIDIAIKNQIHEETNENKDFSDLQIQSINYSTTAMLEKSRQKLLHLLSDIPLEESELVCTPRDLIWSFYNRFFPIKVVTRALASSILTKKWILLSDFHEEGSKFAEFCSDKLKEFEEDQKLPRNKKLSTGLPMPKAEVRGLTGNKYDKKNTKYIASKMRFQDQFIGRFVKKDHVFYGACYEMGLMGVKIENDKVYVSLTDLGRDFALLENPILDNDELNCVFYDDEINFIKQKLIPRFKLEKMIIDKILKELKEKPLKSEDVEEIFENEILTYFDDKSQTEKLLDTISSSRVATMGRLSELRLVDWTIDSNGKSVYSLIKK